MPLILHHFALIPLRILLYQDPLTRIHIILPLPQIDIAIISLKYPRTVLPATLHLPLVSLLCRVLNLTDISHELPIIAVDVVLEKRLDDTSFLLFKLGPIGSAIILHI